MLFFAHRNFARYVARTELSSFEDLAEALGAEYENRNGWGWLKEEPERYRRLVRRYLEMAAASLPAVSERPSLPGVLAGQTFASRPMRPPRTLAKGRRKQCIETVYSVGYRFEVTDEEGEERAE